MYGISRLHGHSHVFDPCWGVLKWSRLRCKICILHTLLDTLTDLLVVHLIFRKRGRNDYPSEFHALEKMQTKAPPKSFLCSKTNFAVKFQCWTDRSHKSRAGDGIRFFFSPSQSFEATQVQTSRIITGWAPYHRAIWGNFSLGQIAIKKKYSRMSYDCAAVDLAERMMVIKLMCEVWTCSLSLCWDS